MWLKLLKVSPAMRVVAEGVSRLEPSGIRRYCRDIAVSASDPVLVLTTCGLIAVYTACVSMTRSVVWVAPYLQRQNPKGRTHHHDGDSPSRDPGTNVLVHYDRRSAIWLMARFHTPTYGFSCCAGGIAFAIALDTSSAVSAANLLIARSQVWPLLLRTVVAPVPTGAHVMHEWQSCCAIALLSAVAMLPALTPLSS